MRSRVFLRVARLLVEFNENTVVVFKKIEAFPARTGYFRTWGHKDYAPGREGFNRLRVVWYRTGKVL